MQMFEVLALFDCHAACVCKCLPTFRAQDELSIGYA